MTEFSNTTAENGVTVHHIHTPVSRAFAQVVHFAVQGVEAERALEDAGGWAAALDPALQDYRRDADTAWSHVLEALDGLKVLPERTASDAALKRMSVVFDLVMTSEDDATMTELVDQYTRFAGLFRMDRSRLSGAAATSVAAALLAQADATLQAMFTCEAFGAPHFGAPDHDPDPFIAAA